MFRPFSPDWSDAFRDAINTDDAFREVGADWSYPVALVLDPPAPDHGYAAPVGVRLAITDGRCASATLGAPADLAATFVLTADYATWKRVVRGETDAIGAVMRGEVRLTGPLTTLLMHAKAAQVLVETARSVPTAFPDEAA